MGIIDTISNAASSVKDTVTNSSAITGNAQKAYLLLRKEVMREEDRADNVFAMADKIVDLANELDAAASTVAAASSLLSMNSALSAIAKEKGYIPIKVQYNPASITFSGLRGEQGFVNGHDGAYLDFDRAVETTMGMELIFDTMEANNAFMMDKTAKDVVTGLVKKKKSVRPIVELLIGATAFTSTRWIGFAWNEMLFWGELVNVSASYIMFDTSGEPVRAKVAIQIRQDQINKPAEVGKEALADNRKAAEAKWDKQFKALGKKKPMMSSSVSNILNTNF